MSGYPHRRWRRRLVVMVALAAMVAALREHKLAENARRFDLPV